MKWVRKVVLTPSTDTLYFAEYFNIYYQVCKLVLESPTRVSSPFFNEKNFPSSSRAFTALNNSRKPQQSQISVRMFHYHYQKAIKASE